MRSDAAESRNRIVEAARRLLAADADVHLNAVAKAASVGQGTLYRHFANREALLVEVYRADIDRLAESARRKVTNEDALVALRDWFGEIADYARIKYGVLAALSAGDGQALTARHANTLADAIDEMLEKGRSDGSIRKDVDSRHVLQLLGFLARIDRPDSRELIPGTLDVIAAGLRAQS